MIFLPTKNKQILGDICIFLAMTLLTIFFRGQNIGHSGIGNLDEACHALVAKNFLKNPIVPTLIETSGLPGVPYLSWADTYIWLHKPPMAMWQSAFSFLFFGVNTFAMRLPSLILGSLAVGLTYLIGRELFDRHAALIASLVQMVSPMIMLLTQGYLFSDAVDISLLFWTELSILFLIRAIKTGSWGCTVFCGITQGIAYLSKSYLALLVTGLAVVALCAPACGMAIKDEVRIRWQHFAILTAIALLIGGSWTLWIATQFPEEFQREHGQIFSHFTMNIEDFADSPLKIIGDYWHDMFGTLRLPILISFFAFLPRLFRSPRLGLTLTYAWCFGVLAPHFLAVSKTPSATLLALPALAFLCGSALIDIIKKIPTPWKIVGAAALSLLMFPLFSDTFGIAWKITDVNSDNSQLSEAAAFTNQHLPQNTVMLVDTTVAEHRHAKDHLELMFMSEITAHLVMTQHNKNWREIAKFFHENGRVPYLMSKQEHDFLVLHQSDTADWKIYSLKEQ